MASREFHLGDILIMNFLTGQSLYTHQLVIMHDECSRELLRQHPDLANVDDSTVTRENATKWLADQVAKYGERRMVSPIVDCEQRDPVSDLEGLVGKDKVIAVEP